MVHAKLGDARDQYLSRKPNFRDFEGDDASKLDESVRPGSGKSARGEWRAQFWRGTVLGL